MVCSTSANFFTTYVAPLASPSIALAVGIVAYQQWRTARDKLRFDLYERRLAVYDAAMDYLAMGMQLSDGKSERAKQIRAAYVRAWREARFLFGKGSAMYNILTEMQNHVIIAMTPVNPADILHNDGNKRLMESQHKSIEWIMSAGERVSDAIEPYLDFNRLHDTKPRKLRGTR